jgi:hypothetical protein
MVTLLIAAKPDAKVAPDERAYIVASAKMHLSIFKAVSTATSIYSR